MAYYLMLFAAGFAGSFHCIGMCGGFACALGRDPTWARRDRPAPPALQLGPIDDLLLSGRARGRTGPGDMHAAGTDGPAAERLPRLRPANPRDCRRAAHDRHGAAVLRPAAGLSSPCERLRQQHVCHVPAQPADGSAAALRRSPLGCSTASCRVPWSMPSSPRRRAPPERFPAFSPWRRLDWGPSPPC